jgi:hypothetical protein
LLQLHAALRTCEQELLALLAQRRYQHAAAFARQKEQALGLSARLEEAAQNARTHARAQAAGAAGSQSAAVVVASQVAAIRAESAASVSVYDLTQQAQLLQQPPQQPVSASRLSLSASPALTQGRAAVLSAVRASGYDMSVRMRRGGAVSGRYVRKWGSQGAGDGKFTYPDGIAISPVTGEVYVVDAHDHRVQVFTSDGSFVRQWGSWGSGDGQFTYPDDIAISPVTGDVYVTDKGNYRVQVFGVDD